MKRHFRRRSTASRLLCLALTVSLLNPGAVLADAVALATAPLATATTSTVKPNVMFVLDNSGSMDWDYLPDWAADSDPVSGTSYNSTIELFRNAGFNGVAYDPAIVYLPPVHYNADGTLNTTLYPSIGSPWTSVKDDAYGKSATTSTNLVTGFPDVAWCTSTAYTNCLRDDNFILPATVGGASYTFKRNTTASGSGSVATGTPDAPTTASRSFGPYYYTIVPGEYCDDPNFKNCQTTQTTTFKYPVSLRWCDSAALTNCQALNSATFKYPRYPTQFFTPAIAYQAPQAAIPAVAAVTGVAASATFTFTYSGSLNPVGFSVKVNGTEMLTATTPGALNNSSGLASWVASHASLSGYSITSSGSTVTITATTTGTAKNINTVVVAETTPPPIVTFTTSTTSGTSAITAVRPTALITFSGTSTSGTANARINRDLSGSNTITLGGNRVSSANPLTISTSNSRTPAQVAAGVVASVGTAGTYDAYVGGNAITPTCASQPTNVVCLVDTSGYTNGSAVVLGSLTNFGGVSYSTTASAGGVAAASATAATGAITFTNASSMNPINFLVQVNGTQINSVTTPNALTSSSGLATWLKNNSSLTSYTITNSGSVVTLTATATGTGGNISSIAITQGTPSTATTSSPTYVAGVNAVVGSPFVPAVPEILAQPPVYYGRFIRTDIVSGNNSYPYPGTSSKASTRTDCAGTTCTYTEEMTNFANWWTYYQVRLQAMKTSVSRAFKSLDNRFRVGFTVISYAGVTDGSTFLGNNTFELAQKNTWFTRLFGTSTSGSTPLRGALSKVGRYYADKLTGQVDPVQYSCQQNFAILSTDGYWNQGGETSTYKNINLSGGLIGDMDGGSTPRPMYEGPTASAGSLADIAKYYYDTDLRTSGLSNCTGGTSPDFPKGNPDVCTNNVFISSTDNNLKQHMTTFTMGLGAEGTLNYTSDYLSASFGDYYNIKNGLGSPTANWPNPQVSSTSTSVQERIDDLWHAAVNGQGMYFSAKNPDQIVSGFNSALSSITAKLGSAAAAATSTLNPVAGNNFAYVASYTTVKWIGNLEARTINTTSGVVSENASWCVENITADTCPSPGTVVADTGGSSTVYNCVTPDSTAVACTTPGVFDSIANTCTNQLHNACTGTMPGLVGATTDSRTIYSANSTGNALIAFDAAYATANPTNFSTTHINGLNQWGTLSSAQQTAAAGVNLLNYLRGQNGYEDRAANTVANRLYRAREAVLGDALESQPAYIGRPVFSYPYTGYSDFASAKAGRLGTVYMGTNDGMMHAFAADTGTERWAYVPSMVIPNLWKLASTSYSTSHVNYVNGSPVTSDIYCPGNCGGLSNGATSASWRTILVGGLNGGGRGYYALDITEPTSPTLLWEFTPAQDSDVGYSFGQPIVTRKADGTWVVLVTSGYDNGTVSSNPSVNNSPAGSGIGYLYVLNASTGAIISKIATTGGTASAPSGLARIAAWNDEPGGNKAGFVYGGDLLGNLWRFDINSSTSATVGTGRAFLFATLASDAAGASSQAITTTPVLGRILNKRLIMAGTGKYLESGDLTTSQTQTVYAITDEDSNTTTLVNPRSSGKLKQRSLINDPGGTATRLVATTCATTVLTNTGCGAVDYNTDRGWFIDFPDGGAGGGSERENIDSKLVEGTLIVPTIIPSSTVCSPGGFGWLNFIDYQSGLSVNPLVTGGLSSVLYQSTIVGVNVIFIGGNPKVEVVTSTNPTPEINTKAAFNTNATAFQGTRWSWRELIP